MGKRQDKGESLKKRVIALFGKTLPLSIKTVPRKGKSKEKSYYLTPNKVLFSKIDVTVERTNETILVIECKNVSNKPIIQNIADRLKRIKNDQAAQSGLIIISGVKISDKEKEDIFKKYKLYVWDDDLLSYYERIASTLKEFALFEIMSSLGINLERQSGDDFRPALYFKQELGGASLNLISFTAYPQDMIKRCYVFRHANKQAKSYQRLLQNEKLTKISEYIREGGKIINSIILLLPDNCKFISSQLNKGEIDKWYYGDKIKGTLGRIILPKKYCFIEIIDGQHRLYSFTRLDKKIREGFPLNFIGVTGGNKELARDIFITINQKAKKIEANLLAAIQEEYDKYHLYHADSLAREIVRELNRNPQSALKARILVGERVTLQQANLKIYIAMLSYNGIKRLVNKEGILKKVIKDNDPVKYYSSINKFLKEVKSVFPVEYQDTTKYIVFTNNGLIPLIRLFGDICKFYDKIPSENQIDGFLRLIKDYSWDNAYFKGLSSGAGWKRVYDELIALIKKDVNFSSFPSR